jgi:hypothetical protein
MLRFSEGHGPVYEYEQPTIRNIANHPLLRLPHFLQLGFSIKNLHILRNRKKEENLPAEATKYLLK